MSWDRDLDDLMPFTITIEDVLARNVNGEPTSYAAPVSLQCSIQGPVKFLSRQQNQEITSAQTVYGSGESSLSTFALDSRVTLPAGFMSTVPQILQIDRTSDGDGFYNHVIYLG